MFPGHFQLSTRLSSSSLQKKGDVTFQQKHHSREKPGKSQKKTSFSHLLPNLWQLCDEQTFGLLEDHDLRLTLAVTSSFGRSGREIIVFYGQGFGFSGVSVGSGGSGGIYVSNGGAKWWRNIRKI